MTEKGLRPIEEIAVGDLVLSRDEKTGETTYKPVTRLFRNAESEIWELKLDVEETTASLKTTAEHPWRTTAGQWVQTSDLRPGMQIIRAEGGPATVVSAYKTSQKAPTFNFEVADFHTYFVGAAGLWVHNQCNLLRTLGQRLVERAQKLSGKNRPAVVAVLKSADGRIVIGGSQGGVFNSFVQDVLAIIKPNKFRGGCAEVNCISRALNKGIDVRGATIEIRNVRGPNSVSPKSGTLEPPCSVCGPLLDFFGINR